MERKKEIKKAKGVLEPRDAQADSGQGLREEISDSDVFLIWPDCLGKDVMLLFSSQKEAARYAKERRVKDYDICDF